MSFPRYERYKDSGVEWLGEVPEHWTVCSFRHSLNDVFNGLTSDQIDETEATVPVTRIETISAGIIDEDRLGFIDVKDARLDRKLVPGDILFSNINSLNMIGNCAIYLGGREIYAGMNLLVFRPESSISAKWLYWLVRSSLFRQVVESLAKPAINQASISQASINAINIVVPANAEQSYIANFLDSETVKIDSLMEEQRRLIELLKEKRQAIISHAVTKGLNPHAPMKDSGNEWIGEVPQHWQAQALRYLIDKIESGTSVNATDEPADADGLGVLKTSCVYSGVFDPSENKTVIPVENIRVTCPLKVGTLIVSRMNTPELVGATGLVNDAPANVYLPDRLWQVSFLNASPAFVYYWSQSNLYRALVRSVCAGTSSSMQNLGQDQYRSFVLAVPPPEEQSAIADFLAYEVAQFDVLMSEANRAIDLLQERRTALISAAVTGKIDVREDIPASSVVEKSYSTGFARQLLAAEILHHCHDHATTGRVKLQKLIHLCEYVAEIDEVNGNYLRKAAGPFDNKTMFGIASGLSKQKWFSEIKDGSRTIYRPLEKAGEHKKYLARWESKLPKIHEVLGFLGNADTQQCEIVSTLYAAWNDLLIEGQAPSDEEIIHEASDPVRWHENKAKIPSDKWPKALKWMRDHGLVPKGYGNHTRHDDPAKEPA